MFNRINFGTLAKNMVIEGASVGTGMAIGTYTTNHDPLNLGDRENRQIAGAVAGGTAYALTKGVISGVTAAPRKIKKAAISRRAKRMAAGD